MDNELTRSDLFGENRVNQGEEEEEVEDEEMSKLGSVCCLSKRTITTALECVLSCVSFTSLIYIILLIYCLSFSIELDLVFLIIGYISIFSLITTPLGLYGCNKPSYCALFAFLFLASYHLYGLAMYFWFNLKAPIFNEPPNQAALERSLKLRGYEYLHYITSGSYTALVGLSILLASCKIISLVDQIEPARVIVVDNSSD